MKTLKVIDRLKKEHIVPIQDNQSIMEAVRDNISISNWGQCGGAMICASCHCYVDKTNFTPASENEKETINDLGEDITPDSRLGCQLYLDKASESTEVLVKIAQ